MAHGNGCTGRSAATSYPNRSCSGPNGALQVTSWMIGFAMRSITKWRTLSLIVNPGSINTFAPLPSANSLTYMHRADRTITRFYLAWFFLKNGSELMNSPWPLRPEPPLNDVSKRYASSQERQVQRIPRAIDRESQKVSKQITLSDSCEGNETKTHSFTI